MKDKGASKISEVLKTNTTLTELDMSRKEIIKVGFMEKKNTDNWIDNLIGGEGFKGVSEALKINTTLTALIMESETKKLINKVDVDIWYV